eukprot:m.153438 g.153438  ORF g.153438 m.153438 type:complete len:229 (-) comp14349_c0_seq6:245-931(-)
MRMALLLTLFVVATAENFNPNRTRYIDNIGTNWLFRGNEPVINGSFAMSALRSSLAFAARSSGKILPDNFTITDISFLNPSEQSDENVESKYFKGNPTAGKFINWVVVGDLTAPPVKDKALLKEMATKFRSWDHDDLPHRMDELHEYMTEPPASLPQVIYMHCEAGTDRTGEISGTYYLKWLNMTLPQALAVNNHIQNRDMSKYSLYALEWFCWFLTFGENRAGLSCG